MINTNRVWAIVMRHFYAWRHDLDRLTDSFYWPAIDIFLWGFAASFLAQGSSQKTVVVSAILTGAIFWMIIWRGQYEITVNLLEEMWSQNLGSLFSSPLTVLEWVAATFVLGILKMILTVVFAGLLAYILYKTNILVIGFYFLPFMVSLLLTGWSIGLVVAGLIIYFGTRIQTFAWTGVALIMPFIGIYYPIAALPAWAQAISSVNMKCLSPAAA